jgi:hypothetical protein
MTAKISIMDANKAMLLNFAAKRPLKFFGGPGVGKTMMAEAYARRMAEKYKDDGGYGLFELNCALANVPDVTGYLVTKPETHKDWTGEPINIINSHYAYPYYFRCKLTGRPAFTFKRGMLLLEEWGQAGVDVKRSLATLVRHGRAGEYFLPEDLNVLILSNRAEDRSGVTREFDFLINSWTELELVPSLAAWLVWADENNVTMITQAYASHNEDIVFSSKLPKDQQPWMTPRSLVSMDEQIKVVDKMNLEMGDKFVRQMIAGTVGDGAAQGYIAFAAIRDHLPKLADIVKNPLDAYMPTELDQRMFISFFLASKADRANFPSLVAYMRRMQKNFGVAFIRSAGKRDKTLVSTREFTEWAIENQQLMAAIHGN